MAAKAWKHANLKNENELVNYFTKNDFRSSNDGIITEFKRFFRSIKLNIVI